MKLTTLDAKSWNDYLVVHAVQNMYEHQLHSGYIYLTARANSKVIANTESSVGRSYVNCVVCACCVRANW